MVKKIANSTITHRIIKRLNRKVSRQFNRVFSHVDREMLVNSFRNIGLDKGSIVCVHSSLSRLGHVVGGADAIIDALIETVRPEGCIMMPSFSMGGSMMSYLDRGEIFDVRNSPSNVGFITEVFRKRPGVLRSLHPTNSLLAWGKRAKEFLRDHDKSLTPYGPDTPYGRIAEEENSFILMLETHIHSLLHHLQERVNFPNFFLPEERKVCFIDDKGKKRTMRTKVMRPRIPYFVAIPSASGTDPDWALLHDFGLIFPRRREGVISQLGYRFDGYQRLYRRRAELEESGTLQTTKVGSGVIGLLHVKSFLEKIEPEFLDLIKRFRSFYDPEKIAALRLPYS
jgi:aminoglycoside 3-N-acetyltransferase